MRGIYDVANGADDSFPGDRLSGVFAGGFGVDGTVWFTGTASKFVVQPQNYLSNPGPLRHPPGQLSSPGRDERGAGRRQRALSFLQH
jgi:hypothetical protein